MTMPTGTGPADPGRAPGIEIPADDVSENDVDVRYLAGQRLPAAGAWLWVTTAEAEPEGAFTAVFLPVNEPHAHGGDVLLHVSPAAGNERWAVPAAQVRVVAVVTGALVTVATWDGLDLDSWPERVRATAAFTRGVLGELRDHGVDLGGTDQIALQIASPAITGFPFLESKHPMTP